jgi:hypothetical protein
VYGIIKGKKNDEKWVGPVEALVALAYKRFRLGAKLKIGDFKISNDHSHQVNVMEYNFDLQSVKRSVFGGKSADMYNLKNPVYFSHIFLELLPKEKSAILLQLAKQGVDNMIDIYKSDQIAQECLHTIRTIISENEISLDGNDDTYLELKDQLRISTEYINNPLTQKSIELWKNHLRWLEDICDLFDEAYTKYLNGSDYESELSKIKIILDRLKDEISVYYKKIIKGK